MKNAVKFLFDINRVSFILIVSPFFVFNSFLLFNSHFFNLFNFISLIISFFVFEILIIIILKKIKNPLFFSIILFSSTFIFFYGYYIIPFFQDVLLSFFDIPIRGRLILIILFLTLIFIQLKFKGWNYMKYVNFYLIIFTFVNIAISSKKNSNYSYEINQIGNNFQQIELGDNSKKPVILIITDEYSSPDELFKLHSDSSVYSFSKHLKNNNWLVRNSSISDEISTIHSLSSLFNFNLSKGYDYSQMDIFDVGSEKLLKSSFYDSLNSKEIDLMNFGIFAVGNSKPLYNLYRFPTNFLEVFLFNSIFNHAFNNTEEFELEGFTKSYFPMELQNKFIFYNFIDTLNSISNNNFFSYVHLYMPHYPYLFNNEFKQPLTKDLNGYVEFWSFTNTKLEILLSDLVKTKKYRIILSGDHGFRGDLRINPNNTFTAFYGFSEKDLTTIKSVQDLGILIYACY